MPRKIPSATFDQLSPNCKLFVIKFIREFASQIRNSKEWRKQIPEFSKELDQMGIEAMEERLIEMLNDGNLKISPSLNGVNIAIYDPQTDSYLN